MYSMTAFGRASSVTSLGQLTCEIHSVNRKGLDLSVFLPKGCLAWDIPLRRLLKEEIKRGQVTVKVFLEKEVEEIFSFEKLEQTHQKLNLAAHQLGFPSSAVSFALVLEKSEHALQDTVLDTHEELEKHLYKVMDEALFSFQKMRKEEGKHLKSDLHQRILLLEDLLVTIEERKDAPLEKYQKKILEKISCLGLAEEPLQHLLIKEIATLAEKLDVTEEIVRLKSHFAKTKALLEDDPSCIGRTLEFLLQEMGREVNTIGSKSSDVEVSGFVVAMKGELEKMREQVQNLE